ncbi:hypothetical protein BCR44DRAFT_40295 [Catenaria anguillulae PL171]|uniref:Uncharacterized protein n=1 Tax=Catenaria anguillulae PL171 TaxID=765915 RepID=A0A1Y2HWK6_9FUNG|nr:hypothetical protein BCR44DRAFT_40295 [Catenaria anguillulae PL171]
MSTSTASASSHALPPPPPRSRTASLSHSASLARQSRPQAQAQAQTQVAPALRPDSVMYSSPSWAQTMPLPKLHDPLPTALPARASVMAQLPPAMRQLGFLGANRGGGGGDSLSSDDDTNIQQEHVYTLDDTPEFRSTISLLEPEGGASDDGGEFAVLNLDASFHDDIHVMFDTDPVYHDDVDAETHDRSAASSSDATLVHAATPPSIEHADDAHQGRYEGLSLAPMHPPSDEQLVRGRRPASKSSAPPDANRVSVVGDLPTFPRKSNRHTNQHHAAPLPSTQEVPSPPTPTRQEIHGAAVGGGTIFGKLKRALSGRRTSPHSPTPPPPAPGRADSDPPANAPTSHHHHHHQRSNSIDQGIGTLRRALSRATSARRRKSPEDPPIPAPSSQAPNPYHNATAAAAQQQQQQQQYQVSPYGTILYNHDQHHTSHSDYEQQPQQQQQFFSPPPESTLGGLGILGGGGDQLYMATLARGDTESDRSLDHASQEVSTNPFATLAGLPLTVPTRTDSRRTSSGAYLLGVPTSAAASGAGHAPDMALTPPDMHEPVPAVFTLARPSAPAVAPPLTPTRIEEQATGYLTLQYTGARGQPGSTVGITGGTDMLAQAREVAAYQTMRRGGR